MLIYEKGKVEGDQLHPRSVGWGWTLPLCKISYAWEDASSLACYTKLITSWHQLHTEHTWHESGWAWKSILGQGCPCTFVNIHYTIMHVAMATNKTLLRSLDQSDSGSMIACLSFWPLTFLLQQEKTSIRLPVSLASGLNSSLFPDVREANTLTLWCRPNKALANRPLDK